MKKLLLLTLIVLLSGCGKESPPPTAPAPAEGQIFSGTVAEVIEVDNYTYLRVESDQGSTWIATALAWVNEGDEISFPGGVLMEDFHSDTLDRTFDNILFVQEISVNGASPEATAQNEDGATAAMPAGHPALSAANSAPALATEPVEPLAGGVTVEQLYAGYPDNAGQTVRLRARVVKFSPNVMGTNWATLNDGTGTAPDNVLVAKTDETLSIGDEVVVEGTLKADVSLGYGYDYKLLLEGARTAD